MRHGAGLISVRAGERNFSRFAILFTNQIRYTIMIYYFEFTLKDGEPFDLTGMRPNDRIVYFAERNSIIFCKSQFAARNYDGEAMTKMIAVGRYPDKFFVMKRKAKKDTNFSIILPPDMYNFCQRRGIIGDYIRSLIRREMDKENNP